VWACTSALHCENIQLPKQKTWEEISFSLFWHIPKEGSHFVLSVHPVQRALPFVPDLDLPSSQLRRAKEGLRLQFKAQPDNLQPEANEKSSRVLFAAKVVKRLQRLLCQTLLLPGQGSGRDEGSSCHGARRHFCNLCWNCWLLSGPMGNLFASYSLKPSHWSLTPHALKGSATTDYAVQQAGCHANGSVSQRNPEREQRRRLYFRKTQQPDSY
jgi:hypothetical protein